MSRFLEIRRLLGLTQEEMAEVLGCTPSNVSFLDRGQTVTQGVADKLIDAGHALGQQLGFDHIYGRAPLPARKADPKRHAGTDWREVLEQLREAGLSHVQIAARCGTRVSVIRAMATAELEDPPHSVGESVLGIRRELVRMAQEA